MATTASEYKRVTSKSRRSKHYVEPRSRRTTGLDRELATLARATGRPLDPPLFRARKATCACGTTTVSVQRSSISAVTCCGCGTTVKEKKPKPTKGMIRRFLDRLARGGYDA